VRYGLHDLDVSALPAHLPLAAGEDGMGVVLRDEDSIVGFRLIRREEGAPDADRLLDTETRQAISVARLRRSLEVEAAAGPPSLTVAICSKDRWDWVDRLLRSLEAIAEGPPVEILVIDNAPSDDRMRDMCATHPGVRYVREPLVGLDFARNRALREATGEVVAFLDDDVTVDRGWLRAMRRVWADNPDAGCVTGLVLPMSLDAEAPIRFEQRGGFRRGFVPFRFAAERLGDRFYPCGAGRFGAGANMSLRRHLVLDLGGFDEALDTGRPLPGGGDLDIFFRVIRSGAVLLYEPQAAVFHEHRRDMSVLKRQYYTWGLGFSAFVAKSFRTDPAMRGRFVGLMLWWFLYQAGRVVQRLRGREPTPLAMILSEIGGGIKGMFGEYSRSQRRIASIRAAA
jgi:GT2 family glycosyltransferase